MANDPEPESDPASGAPAPRHVPIVIEGEATERHAADGEPSPSERSAEFAPTEPLRAQADFKPTEAPDVEPIEPPIAAAEFEPEPPHSPAESAAPAPSSWTDSSPREQPSRGSFVWGISGAVIGAAAALAAAWYFDPRAEPLRELAARQSEVDAVAAAQSVAAKALDARIGALESAQAGFAKAAALDAIDKRLAELETASVKPDVVAAAQAEARAAHDDAAKALAAAAGQGNEKPASPAPMAGPDPRIAELTADQTALGGRIDKLQTALDGRVDKLATTLGDRIGAIETALTAPKTESRAAPTEVPPKVDAAGQAIAALALEQRLRAGEPFAAEWAALSRLGADAAALATLKPYSDTGAPTGTALAASFAKIGPNLETADNAEAGDGVVDRMLDHVRKLVRVRAVSEIAGDDPAALVSQIEAALARGQVAAALGVYGRLPEAARNAGADWAKTAAARVAADAAARSLRESAIGRLAAEEK